MFLIFYEGVSHKSLMKTEDIVFNALSESHLFRQVGRQNVLLIALFPLL